MTVPRTLESGGAPMSIATPFPVGEFEALLESMLNVAYRTAYHFTRNRADAEDLVQDAALLAWRYRASFQRGTNFRAWFLRILTNAFYSRVRKQSVARDTVSLDEESSPRLYALAQASGLATDPDPAQTFTDRLDAEIVSQALNDLPLEFRLVTTMYLVEDLPYQEIASVLDIPVGTVRSRLHRGRALLKRALWRAAEDRRMH